MSLRMISDLRELWRFRELLLTLVERDLRIRYKGSMFGFFWSLLNPLMTVVVMTVIFKFVMRNDTPNFSAYILSAYLPYLFFQMAVLDSAQSVLVALPIIKKVYFPREVLPLAAICSNFIHFLLALGVFFLFLFAVYLADPRVSPFSWNMLLLPIPLMLNLALATGLGLLVSALNTFYEDIKYVVAVGLQLLFFVTPIMYFSEQVYAASQSHSGSSWLYWLYHLNPVATLCMMYRKVLVAPQDVIVSPDRLPWLPIDWGLVAIMAVVSLVTLWFGYRTFNRMKWRFVERP